MTAFPTALPTSRVPDPRSAPTLRWGVIGTGWIAERFVGALLRHTGQHVTAIEAHNRNLKSLPDALPPAIRGRFSVDAFCALEPRDDIDAAIEEAGRGLAAAKAADSIRTRNGFQPIDAPAFAVGALQTLLGRSLPDLDAQAAARIRHADHLKATQTQQGHGQLAHSAC